ncbi:MAG: TRAP transporter small permease [Desulfomonilaceae bacterium]|nr:TRAP transporter small permease [Desulfomonilaceae bacterium]
MKGFIRSINRFEEWVLVFVLLGLAFLTFVQVFCRYVLNFSFTWMEELARYLGVFITFLGAALGVKYGVHFSMNLLYERSSNDRLRHGMRVIVNVLSALLMLVVAWYGWEQTMKLHRFEALTSALQLPKYWFYLPVPFFSVIMGCRFILLAGKHFAAFWRHEPYKALVLE